LITTKAIRIVEMIDLRFNGSMGWDFGLINASRYY